jgi:hypothetical protein
VRELYRPNDLRLSANIVSTFADRGYLVVSVTDAYGRILGFLDRSRYFFFRAAPQLYPRSWVDPVPDPLLLRNCGSAGNRTRNSGSAVVNTDHQTTEAVYFLLHKTKNKLHGLSPRANYTGRAAAACRRSDCQLLWIKGATWSAWRIPTAVFSVF